MTWRTIQIILDILGHIQAFQSSFQTTNWIPDHLTTGHKSTIEYQTSLVFRWLLYLQTLASLSIKNTVNTANFWSYCTSCVVCFDQLWVAGHTPKLFEILFQCFRIFFLLSGELAPKITKNGEKTKFCALESWFPNELSSFLFFQSRTQMVVNPTLRVNH